MDWRSESVASGILADEVGIRHAPYGEVRLRSVFQPILALDRRTAVLGAVRAYLQPSMRAIPIPAVEFYAGIRAEMRPGIDRLVARLHVENRLNAGVDEPDSLDLWLGVDTAGGVEEACAQIDIAAETAPRGVNHIVCEIMRSEMLPASDLAALTARVRERGMRICVDAVGATYDGATLVNADFVKMRGGFFRDLAKVRRAALLIGHMIEGCRGQGAGVLIEGIETRAQFATAIEAGATHVQGFLFGAPALAGTIIDDKPRPILDILYGAEVPVAIRA